MLVAVFGLLFLQLGWIQNVHKLTERKFKEDVEKSIRQTAVDLESLEAIQIMNPDFLKKGIEGSLDDFVKSEFGDFIQSQETIAVRDTIISKNGEQFRFLVVQGNLIDTATGLRAEHRVITKDLRGIAPAAEVDDAMLGLQDDTNSFAIQWNQSFEEQIIKKTNYLNKLMERMFKSNLVDDIKLRLNLNVLDSLISFNLGQNHIDTTFTFNIIRLEKKNTLRQSKKIEYKHPSLHYDKELVKSEFQTLLYPNDPIPSEYLLLVSIPGQSLYVWKEMAGTLIASILLVLIVIFAFYFAVSTIFKQKQLSEIKNDFISNMTHELKTPISTISLACEAVRDPDLKNDVDAVVGFVTMIDKENKRLGKLVENVLQTALIDKGKLKLNLERCRIHELMNQVVDSFQIRYKGKEGEIVVLRSDEIEWDVDKIHFVNVMYNLLDNALKYCDTVPKVTVSLEKGSRGFSLEVVDNGIGIKKEDQKRVFEKLYRVPTGDVHTVKGFGLGLSYVASIVRLHHGTISLKSTIGKGSTFKITIKDE